jgi:hypothetical protein
MYGEMKIIALLFFTSVIDGGEWSASCPCCFIPRKSAPNSHCIGGWVGLRAGLEAVKRKIFCPCQELNPELWAIQPVVILTELSQIHI